MNAQDSSAQDPKALAERGECKLHATVQRLPVTGVHNQARQPGTSGQNRWMPLVQAEHRVLQATPHSKDAVLDHRRETKKATSTRQWFASGKRPQLRGVPSGLDVAPVDPAPQRNLQLLVG